MFFASEARGKGAGRRLQNLESYAGRDVLVASDGVVQMLAAGSQKARTLCFDLSLTEEVLG